MPYRPPPFQWSRLTAEGVAEARGAPPSRPASADRVDSSHYARPSGPPAMVPHAFGIGHLAWPELGTAGDPSSAWPHNAGLLEPP